MTNFMETHTNFSKYYLFGSRYLTHAIFWFSYYLFFSVIWMKPDQGYFASFYLEFVLMPVRILAAYCMIYVLIPQLLAQRKYLLFFATYILLLVFSGGLQLIFSYFYFQTLMPADSGFSLDLSAWARNAMLINTTVILLGAAKIWQMYILLLDATAMKVAAAVPGTIEVKSDRRIHRIQLDEILFVQGMGNYVTYFLQNGEKRVVYSSIKETESLLSVDFLRLHRSYIINRTHIKSYSKDNVIIDGYELPRGKEIVDDDLRIHAQTSLA